MKQPLELLAPAKNLASGMAAIDHGADAVYIGASRFGARAAAGNSMSDIAELCSYAHQFGARVYVTVNTIIYDDELEPTRRLLSELKEARADAILVQDMAVRRMALDLGLTVHASTQTDNRTAAKVRWLAHQGFRRVVLARELSIDEIAAIHEQVPEVELEVFVHGALCVSYSGLCYASQHCFGRSANRGECAQFCRMPFDLVDADGRVIEHDRHLLSLKDMCQIDNLERLARAGATSFKIEGRLKDIDYVKNVTAAYSERLNQIVRQHPDRYERASRGQVHYTFTPDLHKTFNRGYTTYFADGRQPDIASFDTPKAIGEYVGTVKELRAASFTVAGTARFANGDGLCFINGDKQLEGFRVNRAEGNRLFPLKMPSALRPGLRLYRNSDRALERLLDKPSAERKVEVTMALRPTPDGFSLTMGGTTTVTVGCQHQTADKPQRENIVRQLTRLGGTPYSCAQVDLPADFNYFIPSSLLAELRRKAVASFTLTTATTPEQSMPVASSDAPAPAPEAYTEPYLYNVSNRTARRFYDAQGIPTADAFELHEPPRAMLMQCRHCLRYALGFCVRHGGRRPQWREPLALRLRDGRRFPLEFDCRRCQMNVLFTCLLALLLTFTSCYRQDVQTSDALPLTEAQMDSISFYSTHHYTQNYNFLVRADSLQLIVQIPSEAVSGMLVDTISVRRADPLVVADIITMPTDTVDSVWVQVARDAATIGWIHESELLPAVCPDNPISQFVDFFSDAHLLVILAFVVVVAAAFVIRLLTKRNAKIVHFNDIPSFYPTLLCLLVAASAVLYSTIQLFNPASWRHYYYHPTLNPFTVPLHLGLFLAAVWAMLIVAMAAFDDLRRHLAPADAFFYALGLVGVCAVDYVLFSVTTLYYVGYPLLLAYIVFAAARYFRTARPRFHCGQCGAPLHKKGLCQQCGALNE